MRSYLQKNILDCSEPKRSKRSHEKENNKNFHEKENSKKRDCRRNTFVLFNSHRSGN